MNAPWPVLDPLDHRLNIVSKALADARLKGAVAASRYSDGRKARVSAVFADLQSAPRADSGLDSQILHGEPVRVFDERDGYLWVQAGRDFYAGWTRSENIGELGAPPTHWVVAPRSFVYPEPDLKRPRLGYRSMGSLVAVTGEVETRGTRYFLLAGGGAMIARHLRPVATFADDYVSVAERLLETPYLWGGATAFGLDCSGLVQLSMRMAGIEALKDSDMQAATIGKPVSPGPDWSDLRRGDLIFWRGHVAIAMGGHDGEARCIHASGYQMQVVSEVLEVALSRIERQFEKPIGVRRPPALTGTGGKTR